MKPYVGRPAWLPWRLALVITSCVPVVVGCQQVESGKAAGPKASRGRTPVAMSADHGKFEVDLLGVVALMETGSGGARVVHAVVPKNRSERDSRFLKNGTTPVKLPAHRSFVRWRDVDLLSKKTNEPVQTVWEKKTEPYGLVFLQDDESLSIEGGNPQAPLKYDKPEKVAEKNNAYYWVTSFGRFCPKRDYISPEMATPLIRIEHGTLGALPPWHEWRFTNPNDQEGPGEGTAVARGVTWTLSATGDSFTVKSSKGTELKFKVALKHPVEIGNYPEKEAQMKVVHIPQKDDIDPHFELYDDFFVKKHEGLFHFPRYVGRTGSHTGGPSCAPTHFP